MTERHPRVSLSYRVCSLIAAVATFLAGAAAADCRPDLVQLKGDWGQAQFRVELADEPLERQRGLMYRETLSRGAGMLFVYEHEQQVTFWMRDTLIPLDMIFADAAGVVQKVHHEAQPRDDTLIAGGSNIQHVLEINGGLAAALGVDVGTHLRHPSIAQDQAAWRCP